VVAGSLFPRSVDSYGRKVRTRSARPCVARAAYNRAQRLAERRQMMQAWADYLVRLKEGAVS
jgi:hypothetical protein